MNHAKRRMPELDLMRGFAVLCMIAVHTQMLYTLKTEAKLPWGKIISFLGGVPAAPTFLYLMGFLIGVKPRGAANSVFFRAAEILLLGYLLNFLRFSLPIWLGVPLQGDAWLGLWMIDILQLAAPMMIFLWIIKPVPAWFVVLLIPAIVLASPRVWGLSHSPHVLDFLWGDSYLVFFSFFPWAVYPLFGWLSSHWNAKQRLFISGPLLIVGIVALRLFPADPEYYSYYRSHPAQVCWMLGFCGLWHSLAIKIVEKMPSWWMQTMVFFSENVTSAYVFSWLILSWGVCLFGYRKLDNWESLAILLGAIAITTLAIWAWKRRSAVFVRGQTRNTAR